MTDTPNDTLPPTTFEVTNPSSSQTTGATATNSSSTRLLDNDNDSSSVQPPLPGWYLTSSNYLLTLSWLIWVLHLGHTTSVSATFVEYMCYAVISINNFNVSYLLSRGVYYRLLQQVTDSLSSLPIPKAINEGNNSNPISAVAASSTTPDQSQLNGNEANATSSYQLQQQQQQPTAVNPQTHPTSGYREIPQTDMSHCDYVWHVMLSLLCWFHYRSWTAVSIIGFNFQNDLLILSIGIFWGFLLSRACNTLIVCDFINRTPAQATLVIAGTFWVVSTVGFIVFYAHRKEEILPLKSLFLFEDGLAQSDSLYNGDAYVRNVTLAVDPDQTGFCEKRWDDVIPVNVEIYFGGSWACPTMSDAECQVTIPSEVGCVFFEMDYNEQLGFSETDDWEADDGQYLSYNEIEATATEKDYFDYVQRHYHNSRYGKDDDAYDPYGFDDDDTYDPNKAPGSRGSWWTKNTESIIGNCNTCEAMSQIKITRTVSNGCKSTTYMYTFAGAIVACMGIAAAAGKARKTAMRPHQHIDSMTSSSYSLW